MGPALRRLGVGVLRLAVLRPTAREPSRWLSGTPRPPRVDVVLATSRHAVLLGLLPWSRLPPGPVRGVSFWASGPGTAKLLREHGFGPVRRGPGVGAAGILAGLAGTPQRILYLRSDLAGPGLARQLRRQGHHVTERVVYDTRTDPGLVRRNHGLLRRADLLVVTSPSAFLALRRGLGATELRGLREAVPVVVLGSLSASAARSAGFRRVVVVPPTTPQRFARRLVRELADGRP